MTDLPAPRDRIADGIMTALDSMWSASDGLVLGKLHARDEILDLFEVAFPVLAAEPTTAVTEEQHNIMASRGYDPNLPGEYERFIADGETFEWREQAGSDRTDPRFEAWEQEFFRHQPVLSMKHGGIVGCQCMDRVFVSKSEDWGTHLAEVAWQLAALTPAAEPTTDVTKVIADIREGLAATAEGGIDLGNDYLHGMNSALQQVEEGLAALAPEPAEHVLTVRENPVMPSDEQLLDLYTANIGISLNSPSVAALRAIWRVGCDAGMVAP